MSCAVAVEKLSKEFGRYTVGVLIHKACSVEQDYVVQLDDF